jgi:hypothetical protein
MVERRLVRPGLPIHIRAFFEQPLRRVEVSDGARKTKGGIQDVLGRSPLLPAWRRASHFSEGVGMGGGLYDAAFATLGRAYGTQARSAITTLTLWGGFASTICWPIRRRRFLRIPL